MHFCVGIGLIYNIQYVHVVKFFPDNNDALLISVAAVIIVLILCCCIMMDILFCFCCKRKEQLDQSNGKNLRTYVIIYYLCMHTSTCIRT